MAFLRTLLLGTAVAAMPSIAQAADATASLTDTDGAEIGSVTFTTTASGFVLIDVTIESLPAGEHAIHIHETGDCSADDFSSAGGHLAFGMEHGVMAEAGPHPGDLPNLNVGEDGAVSVGYFNDRISLAPDDAISLFDDDGSAVVIHAGPDDYASQPSGDAGDPIACGVIEQQ